MSPAALLILQCLTFAEPFATIAVLLAWIHAGERGFGMPAMRDYLVARSANTAVNVCLLYFTLAHPQSHWYWFCYVHEFWFGVVVLVWLMVRVLGDVLQRSLQSLEGLQAVAKVIFRWVLTAAMLLALPATAGFAMIFLRARRFEPALFTFFRALAIAQVLPVSLVAILGMWVGYRPLGRHIGILAAFCLEPTWMFLMAWIRDPGIMIWTNLITEIICYGALAIWAWYAFHPEREDALPRPNATLQHWDQLACRALRHHLPAIEGEEAVLPGARPWPRPND